MITQLAARARDARSVYCVWIVGGQLESVVWHILYAVWVVGEIVIAFATRRQSDAKQDQDRGTQVLLWIVIVLSLTAAGFLKEMLPSSFRWREPWLRPLALALMIAGLTVRAAAIVTLGPWFTANVSIHSQQRLRKTGLYRVVRHPSYLGMELIFLAVGLYSESWIVMLVTFVPPSFAVLHRIRVEEAALTHAFGESYNEYCRTTKRLVPGLY